MSDGVRQTLVALRVFVVEARLTWALTTRLSSSSVVGGFAWKHSIFSGGSGTLRVMASMKSLGGKLIFVSTSEISRAARMRPGLGMSFVQELWAWKHWTMSFALLDWERHERPLAVRPLTLRIRHVRVHVMLQPDRPLRRHHRHHHCAADDGDRLREEGEVEGEEEERERQQQEPADESRSARRARL